MGLIKILTSLAFIALFSFALISYLTGFADDNVVYTSINNDSELSNMKVLVEQNLSEFKTDSESAMSALWKSEISEGDETSRTGGQFKTNPSSIFGTTKTIMSSMFSTIFGNDTNFGVVLTTLIAFIGFIIGLYVWKTWKGGNPD